MPDIENVPPIGDISSDQMDRIKAELGLMEQEADASTIGSADPIHRIEPTPIKRRRGRPRKYVRDENNRPIKDQPLDENSTEEIGVLPSPPLTSRDSKDIALRLKGILVGGTAIGAVLNPAIQMTDKEAENISTPLTAYLVRTEATSQIAKRVLNEYDLTAFVIATMAYMVRVIRDIRSERESNATPNGDESQGRRILQRVPTSQRVAESAIEPIAPETIGSNENGQEGAVGVQWPIPATKHGDVTEV